MADDVVEPLQPAAHDSVKPDSTGQPTPPGDVNPQAAAPAQTAADDRTRGILADLQKERRTRQQYEQDIVRHRSELEQANRRIQALAGVAPQSEGEQEAEQIRARFRQLFPELADLTADDIKALRDLKAQASGLQDATTHHYKLHGRKMLDAVGAAVSKHVGGTLSPRQLARLESAYVREAETHPEFLERHDSGDLKLVEEFTKEWIDDWFEPARRRVTQTELDRQRRVPSGRDRSVAATGGKKIDFNNPKAVEDAMVEAFVGHGGAFGE